MRLSPFFCKLLSVFKQKTRWLLIGSLTCSNLRLVVFNCGRLRPVGPELPAAGETLPWTPAGQPRRPAGELGYCGALSLTPSSVVAFSLSLMLNHVFAEGQWREKENRDGAMTCDPSEVISQKHMETLRHICRTHLRCRNTSTLICSWLQTSQISDSTCQTMRLKDE